jgi:(4-(4-[2-(gamma-L-glutamylamino)ethyl]phenoxymethyl)furan-2-yl)methanamine synthase
VTSVLGWDIGGANLKAALAGGAVGAPVVIERPFPIWREPANLPVALAEMSMQLGAPRDTAMAVTMTAELADCFATKREGVSFVLDALVSAFPDARLSVYGVDGRFWSVDAAKAQPLRVAAANWRASATLVARSFPDAIFLDVGSTTTDVIPIVSGQIAVRGRTDPTRLRSGELVYTGALRTPISAIVRYLPFRGRRCRVAAEHFAIAADAHRWLGRIDDAGYTCDTADGRGTGREESGARLARMICADLEMLTETDVTAIAAHAARAQVRQVAGAVEQVLRRLGGTCPALAVLAGQGAFIGRDAAERCGLATRQLANDVGSAAARAVPAAAVAILLAEALEG